MNGMSIANPSSRLISCTNIWCPSSLEWSIEDSVVVEGLDNSFDVGADGMVTCDIRVRVRKCTSKDLRCSARDTVRIRSRVVLT